MTPGYPPQGYAPPAYQQPYACPTQGQSPQQAAATQQQCEAWASAQSGITPNAPGAGAAQPSGQAATAGAGSVVRGGARGAAVGAVGGAVGGDAEKGAEAGAAMGGLVGGFKRKDQQQAETQQQTQQAQQQSQKSAAYSRALEACLTGQGYTVR